ncbi:MAG: hypothetical protein GXO85_06640 [Chlorobi bacterium]|nr:hypothetical protein [Chlorobiota bacterium]
MKDLQKKTNDIVAGLPLLNKVEHRFMDLIEEVGELSTAIMYFEEFKIGRHSGKYNKEDISDALSDIMFDLFVIADKYDFDLGKEYSKMLKRLDKRVEEE